jgi:hypothetical protein
MTEAILQLLKKRELLRHAGIAVICKDDVSGGDMLRLEAHRSGLDFPEAAEEQSSGSQENERSCDLQGHENLTEESTRGVAGSFANVRFEGRFMKGVTDSEEQTGEQ